MHVQGGLRRFAPRYRSGDRHGESAPRVPFRICTGQSAIDSWDTPYSQRSSCCASASRGICLRFCTFFCASAHVGNRRWMLKRGTKKQQKQPAQKKDQAGLGRVRHDWMGKIAPPPQQQPIMAAHSTCLPASFLSFSSTFAAINSFKVVIGGGEGEFRSDPQSWADSSTKKLGHLSRACNYGSESQYWWLGCDASWALCTDKQLGGLSFVPFYWHCEILQRKWAVASTIVDCLVSSLQLGQGPGGGGRNAWSETFKGWMNVQKERFWRPGAAPVMSAVTGSIPQLLFASVSVNCTASTMKKVF